MTTNVLIINRQLVFAVTIKQALEQTGLFDVHAFTTAESALDYLRENPHDVALVDFDLSGRELLRALRMIQPDIGVVISPIQPEAERLQRAFNFQGMVDMPFTAREIIPYIEHAAANRPRLFTDETQSLADTADQPPNRRGAKRTAEAGTSAGNAIDDFFGRTPQQVDEAAGEESQAPPHLPEFSSWDSVMEDEAPSEIFEPPVNDQDTPPVPLADSNAVRQYLATNPGTTAEFGDLLSAIDEPASTSDPATKAPNNFTELVNSMRVDSAHTPLPDRHQQFVEFILTGGMDALLGEIEKAKTDPLDEAPAQPTTVFEKLAAEEPPMPTLEESGTVADLMLGVSDTGFRNVLALMRGEDVVLTDDNAEPNRIPADIDQAFSTFFETQVNPDKRKPKRLKPTPPPEAPPVYSDFRDEFSPDPPPAAAKDSSIPAQLILETALDESTPVESFSLDELINSIDKQLAQHTPEVQPLPSWNVRFKPPKKQQPQERFIDEPDFLPEEFPTSRMMPVVDEPIEPTEPVVTEPPPPPTELPQVWEDWADAEAVAQQNIDYETPFLEEINEQDFEQAYTPPVLDEFLTSMDAVPDEQPAASDEAWEVTPVPDTDQAAPFDYSSDALDMLDDDPQIAQIALSLTQVSLELTAEATLLTRYGKIIAVDGQLTQQDIAELRDVIAGGTINEDEARIGFITLNTNGKSYMLYSRQTIGDFVLSMVFAADTPLRDIRRQGKRLMEALESVPEAPAMDAANSQQLDAVREETRAMVHTQAVAAGVLAPYAYVWLLRDPNKVFAAATAQAISAGLRIQLGEQGWKIHTVQVQNEYVYLLADVPGTRPASEIVRELKRRAGEIARVQDAHLDPQTLWADSYLVLTPGRELEPDEINQFIDFERMF